ncbi:selenocysteine-specific elongation factor [Hathewaya proteolytica DSM 3090]|uniref:Selenocysteine-specific elongation factor n=1 Tax=Hathewaya proteolytica DSM 3090 TaxID=1121331 RepID=A0A1M6JIA2_9CLOT|nr:selenocysteine-specific translation elongation factor [Hathewaya proteolytica]SHJ46406.1 selenocysteine-specific elongation factor [Hathewaya proteolytica DSM 3090]
MKNVIIGTAGHIDHGKTSLIRALTGHETDTLNEEKQRGISINLGFTFFDLPSKRRAGIIDVPGHEKFIKNMLAGISGIDLVLMVIAADEGIMPQTKEHLEILQLLKVKRGIVVLTKKDMVDKEWLEVVEEDVREYLKDTFLKDAPIHKVSSKTKEGLDDLIKDIDKFTENIEGKEQYAHFRLPVDRAFTVSGFGTVITGTIIGGSVQLGQEIEIYPSKVITKVRSIQVHGESKDTAYTGQRCAINLANVKLSEVKRGCVIAEKGIMEPSMVVDCKLYYIKSMDKPFVNRQRVRLYHGTEEILCRVVLLDREELQPGEECFAQLRLESCLTCQRNDRFVIRSYSPMITIGGGSIVNPVSKKVKRYDKDFIEELTIKESGETNGIVEKVLLNISEKFPDEAMISKELGKGEENINSILEELIGQGSILKIQAMDNTCYLHRKYFENKSLEIDKYLLDYHKQNPLKIGVSKEEFKNKIFSKNMKQKIYDELLNTLREQAVVDFSQDFVFKYGFTVNLNREQQRMKDKIIKFFQEGRFNPGKYEELSKIESDKKTFKMVYDMLLSNNDLIRLNEDCVLLSEYYLEAKDIIITYIKENKIISTPTARELLNTNRKNVVAILEHMDSCKITKRVENDRVLY